jgi:RNA polymerase sigma-70 factor (ECF subfamily)
MTNSKDINTQLIQDGNHLEFARLVDVYAGDLFLYAKGIVRQAELAEEVVNDVFLRVWESREQLKEIQSLKGYLYKGVQNAAISTLRKKHKNVVGIEDIPEFHFEPVQSVDESLISHETLMHIYRAIDLLPVQTRQVFALAKIQGLKYKEIAELLGISVKTVDYHIASAIEKLCAYLGHDKKKSKVVTQKLLSILFGSVF